VFEIASVVHQQVEVAEILADTLCRRSNRSRIRHVDLNSDRTGPYLLHRGSPRSKLREPTNTVRPCATSSFATWRPTP
jgi:hypothetical protein